VARPTEPQAPRDESAAPPPPDAKFDVGALIDAAKPKDVAAVVKRVGELLYGEAVTAAQTKRIEAFLLTPGPAPSSKPTPPKGPQGAPSAKVEAVPDAPEPPAPVPPKGPPQKGEAKKPEAKKDAPPKPLDPKDVKIDSPAFKARVREAVHAMMCLPEYQLN
jgi:hypothetical protein